MTSLILIYAYLGCVSSGAMLSMLILLVVAYVTAAVWLISHGAVYSGLLYILVYVGAIVVLIMFVVQLTNTSLNFTANPISLPLVFLQNAVLVICLSLMLTTACQVLGEDLLFNVVSNNVDETVYGVRNLNTISTVDINLVSFSSLSTLASSIFNEYGYVLVISVHAIILAIIGPIKLALSEYR